MSYTTAARRADPGRPSRAPTGRELRVLVAFLLISAAVAAFGSLVSVAQIQGWYAEAPHVTWTPPGWPR